jgi:hypothetical protein
VPGYPRSDPLDEDFWPMFWKIFQATRHPAAGERKLPWRSSRPSRPASLPRLLLGNSRRRGNEASANAYRVVAPCTKPGEEASLKTPETAPGLVTSPPTKSSRRRGNESLTWTGSPTESHLRY